MAYISVDCKIIKKTANEIDIYIKRQKSNYQKMTNEIGSLNVSWQGIDYETAKKAWDEINDKESTSLRLIEELSKYADYLRMVEKEYKSVQDRALDRANSLPK